MINCDNQCETCRKYTTVHYNGTEYVEYNCIVAGKDVKVVYDENGNEERRDKYKNNIEFFGEINDMMNKNDFSNDERKTVYLGLIAGNLAAIADALEERKVGDTDGTEIHN
jgi:hypothetical protein